MQPEKASSPDAVAQLMAWAPELIVVAAFGQLLRPVLLGLPRHGCVNVHASLLPRWRGAAPIQAAIAAGDLATGVTLMKMDEGLDTGGILTQRSTNIRPDDTGGSLTERLAILGAQALGDSIPAYVTGTLKPRPQESELATKAPMLRKEDGLLDPAQPAEVLARKVRAYHPWPGTYISMDATILKVRIAHAVGGSYEPGARSVVDRHPVWGTVEGGLVLDEVQPAGKKPMPGDQFLIGAKHWPR
jgi:methionyl-tRNA formyltransferase